MFIINNFFFAVFKNLIDRYGTAVLDGNHEVIRKLTKFLGQGQRPIGYEIELQQNISKRSEYHAQLFSAKVKEGAYTKFKLLNPSKPMRIFYPDQKLQLKPESNYYGETVISIRPVTQSWNGSFEAGDEVVGSIIINPVNDVPQPREKVNQTLPMVSSDPDLNLGIKVGDLAGVYYQDVDDEEGEGVGLALMYADTPNWGSWQYQEPGSNQWTDVSDLDTFPVPDALKLDQTYRGSVPMTEYVSQIPCSFIDGLDDTCKEELKGICKGKGKGSKKTRALETSSLGRNLRKLVSHDINVPDNSSSGSGQDLSMNVAALLLSPDALIRFNPNDKSKSWTTFEAMSQTRLVFTAWDMSDGRRMGQRMNVSLPWCCQCGPRGSLARDLTLFYIDKQDCTGGPVITEAKTEDTCGVCGGDGTACLDCNNVVNGPAVLECGTCYTDVAAAAAARDCAGSCGGNVVITLADKDVCVPETEAGNFTLCDGSSDGDAKINDCGVCYGGNTGNIATTGMDQCGNCVDQSDPVKTRALSTPTCECDQQLDDCGECAVPDTDGWNGKNECSFIILYLLLL